MSDEQEKTNRLLITGAYGFLGSEIVRQCQQAGRPVRSVGRQARPTVPDYTRIDLVNDEIPDHIFAGIDTVIHAAGLAHQFGRSGTNEQAFDQVNRVAVTRTILAAAHNGVKHFVLVSSSGVYGPSASFATEATFCNPEGFYAISKYVGEKAAIAIAQESGIRLTIARMTTLYGAKDRGNLDRLIQAIDRKRFVQIGPGTNRKNLIHKVDAASACLALADAAKGPIEIYNVGGESVTMQQVVDEITQALSISKVCKIPTPLATMPATLLSTLCLGKGPAARLRDSVNKWLRSDQFDTSKFRNDFGFSPRMSLPVGIRNQVEHYRSIKQGSPCGGIIASVGKRIFDVSLSLFFLALLAVPMSAIALLVRGTSPGPALYWSRRVGQNNKLFSMAKFRSMRTTAPEVATHLLSDANSWITPLGNILRKTSLDELPQLLQILQGHMSFVGPRPALHNQEDLVELRTALEVHTLRPGVTGLAQVSGRDELLICEKVEFDRQYLHQRSLLVDLQILFRTAYNVLLKRGVKQADDDGDVQAVTVKQSGHTCCFATPSVLSAVAIAMGTWPGVKVVCWRAPSLPSGKVTSSSKSKAIERIFILRAPESCRFLESDETAKETASTMKIICLPDHEFGSVSDQLKNDIRNIHNVYADFRSGGNTKDDFIDLKTPRQNSAELP